MNLRNIVLKFNFRPSQNVYCLKLLFWLKALKSVGNSSLLLFVCAQQYFDATIPYPMPVLYLYFNVSNIITI